MQYFPPWLAAIFSHLASGFCFYWTCCSFYLFSFFGQILRLYLTSLVFLFTKYYDRVSSIKTQYIFVFLVYLTSMKQSKSQITWFCSFCLIFRGTNKIMDFLNFIFYFQVAGITTIKSTSKLCCTPTRFWS